jgi:SSS family solute:Na+ symporter
LKPLHAVSLGGTPVTIYIGLLALAANIVVACLLNVLLPAGATAQGVKAKA